MGNIFSKSLVMAFAAFHLKPLNAVEHLRTFSLSITECVYNLLLSDFTVFLPLYWFSHSLFQPSLFILKRQWAKLFPPLQGPFHTHSRKCTKYMGNLNSKYDL